MAGAGGSCDVRSRAFARLVRKESPLDAVHHRRAQTSTGYLGDAEGIAHQHQHEAYDEGDHGADVAEGVLHYQGHDLRNHIRMGYDDVQRKGEIAQGHDRNYDAADLRNSVYAPEYDGEGQYAQQHSDQVRISSESHLHRVADGVALDGIV